MLKSDLQQRIIASLDGEDPAESLEDHTARVEAALRIAAHLHKPIRCGFPACENPETHRVCLSCGSTTSYPCPEIEAIAKALSLGDETEVQG